MVAAPGLLSHYMQSLESVDPVLLMGRITQVVGLVAEAQGILLPVGSSVFLHPSEDSQVLGEVVGFRGDRMLIMPYADTRGLRPGCPVSPAGSEGMVKVGPGLLGRVVDGLGNPVDGGPELEYNTLYSLYNDPPAAVSRRRISDPVDLGGAGAQRPAHRGQRAAHRGVRRFRRGQVQPFEHGGPPHLGRCERDRPGG